MLVKILSEGEDELTLLLSSNMSVPRVAIRWVAEAYRHPHV